MDHNLSLVINRMLTLVLLLLLFLCNVDTGNNEYMGCDFEALFFKISTG